jgi:hypothetical protein
MSAMIFLRRLWKIPQLTTSIRLPNHHVNCCSAPRPVPRPEDDIDQLDENVSADAESSASVHAVGEPATMLGGREGSTL